MVLFVNEIVSAFKTGLVGENTNVDQIALPHDSEIKHLARHPSKFVYLVSFCLDHKETLHLVNDCRNGREERTEHFFITIS